MQLPYNSKSRLYQYSCCNESFTAMPLDKSSGHGYIFFTLLNMWFGRIGGVLSGDLGGYSIAGGLRDGSPPAGSRGGALVMSLGYDRR